MCNAGYLLKLSRRLNHIESSFVISSFHTTTKMSTVFNISFQHQLIESYSANHGVLVVGKKEHLLNAKEFIEVIRYEVTKQEKDEHFASALEKLSANDYFETCYSKLKIATLPSKGTRHNTPMFSHSLSNIVKSSLTKYDRRTVVIVCERIHAFALGCAVGRVFPLYQQKTSGDKTVDILVEFKFVGDNKSPLISNEIDCLTSAMEPIRLTARIVDTPCNQMHTDIFLDEVRKVGKELGIEPMIIQGEDLVPRGFGGIYGVGKAAVHQPALAVLSHKPQGATKNIAWCGKGIVYDTGGLSIKDKVSMPGMKRDCGGAAGILGAFRTAVKLGFKENLHAVLCLAENAVGPKSARPDDVHTLYSGLTVEINNTDAEGRLVLGDGVAYAKKDLNADIILDMATLTGAQGISTGMYHAAVLTNNELWEESCVEAGKMSGDLCFPVPYTPEFHFDEFHSEIADMKNSVKNRSNAQVSCAGLFIGRHIGFNYTGVWIHIDMAYPVEYENERATGYGVALLLTLFGHLSENEILKLAAPKNLTS